MRGSCIIQAFEWGEKKKIWSVLKGNELSHIFSKLKGIFQLQQFPLMVQDEPVHSKRDLLQDAPGVTSHSLQRGYRTRGSHMLACGRPAAPARRLCSTEGRVGLCHYRGCSTCHEGKNTTTLSGKVTNSWMFFSFIFLLIANFKFLNFLICYQLIS